MYRIFLQILTAALLISPAAFGQSLGDIARENREKKQAEDTSVAPTKVITNQDLSKDPNASTEPPQANSQVTASVSSDVPDHRSADRRTAEKRLAEQRAAEQWTRQIVAQKNKILTLQARIDQLNASLQSANGTVQSEGPYNRYQARQMQRIAQVQLQLDEQQRKLDQMQDAARRAGMHTAVYDP